MVLGNWKADDVWASHQKSPGRFSQIRRTYIGGRLPEGVLLGLFSRSVPQRKWPEITADLGLQLKRSQDEWFAMVQKEAAIRRLELAAVLPVNAKRFISILQIGTVASTIAEYRYVKTAHDSMFLAECMYIPLMSCRPEQMYSDIEEAPFAVMSGDLRLVLKAWGSAMANEMLPHTQRAEGAAMLEQYAAVIVVTAKINTCVAFGDTRAADRLSKELFH